MHPGKTALWRAGILYVLPAGMLILGLCRATRPDSPGAPSTFSGREPTPLWTTTVRPPKKSQDGNSGSQLSLTRTAAVVSGYSRRFIIAFDVRTGREVWRRETPEGPDSRTERPSAPDPSEQDWRLAGAVAGAEGEETAVVTSIRSQYAHAPASKDLAALHLEGIEMATGRRLWQVDLRQQSSVRDTLDDPVGVYGGVLVIAHRSGKIALEFRDAATGASLNIRDAEGRAALRRAAARRGGRLVPIGVRARDQFRGYLLDLADGSFRPLPECEMLFPEPAPMVLAKDRVIAHLDFDPGGAGGTAAPKIVRCVDLSGKNLWEFPLGEPPLDVWPPAGYYRVWQCLFVRDAGVVIAESDQYYGLDIRNGGVLWTAPARESTPPYRTHFAPRAAFRAGCFGVGWSFEQPSKPPASWLGFMDAKTGWIKWLAPLSAGGVDTAISGDNLVVLGAGELRAYSASKLLSGVSEKALDRPSR